MIASPIPIRETFRGEEWNIICRKRTPFQVQQYLNSLPYNNEKRRETLRSFRGVVEMGSAHCLEAALAAAVILEQHGYPAHLLDLVSQDGLDHVVFLFRAHGKWGAIGRSRDPGLHGRKPVFRSIQQLVASFAEPFVDFSGRLVGYGVYDLADLGNYNWRLSEQNVWRVQRSLIEMPHRTYRMSDRCYRFWHDRFLTYKKRFPTRKPLYYPNRGSWMSGYRKFETESALR